MITFVVATCKRSWLYDVIYHFRLKIDKNESSFVSLLLNISTIITYQEEYTNILSTIEY